MIDIKSLENEEFASAYKQCLKNRGADVELVDRILELNKSRKQAIQEFETRKAEQNKVGQEIAKLKKSGEDASQLLSEMQQLAQKTKDFENQAAEVQEKVNLLLSSIPNMCHPSVPVGKSEEDNVLVRSVGNQREFSFKPKEHIELGENLGLLDFERAGKVSGARFSFLRGSLARLERALAQFMLESHVEQNGYQEIIPPYIVNSSSLFGTGNFPKFKDDVFHLEGTDYHLIPTAEVPLTNFYGGETLKEEDLPQKFVALSPCFRSEAGSYGKDTKGLIRQHQFHKVEMMVFSHPDQSYELHDQLTGHAEKILQDLELPYRVMALCTGDISFGAAKCYDIEVWLPGQNAYREISSCSNFEDFQARRANIRFKENAPKSKPRYVHTLNGSGLAVGRTLIAVMENYQKEDGTIEIPKALQKYMGGQSHLA
ncbi:MAG: serine--tRNA ligase [Bdellovibrionaceae bacterium]|nr:serine--tRNA ligase [Pseudobdellovibrionaceae bacterium]|tara:strand:+ start:737 stop:2020 length:1284 start_codon:yes stop_codon:yes gene_type:complete